jgi:hypothetical protein
VTDAQRSDGPQQVEHGVIAEGQKGCQQQDHDAVKGRAVENGKSSPSEPVQQWRSLPLEHLQHSPNPPSTYLLLPAQFVQLHSGETRMKLPPLRLGETLAPPCAYADHASLLASEKRNQCFPSTPTRRLVFV